MLRDVVVFARYLIGLPLMLLTPEFTGQRLTHIVNHFTKSKLIKESESDKFSKLVDNTLRLRDSSTARLIIWVIIYGIVYYLFKNTLPTLSPSWQTIETANGRSLSLTGWWFNLVTQPVYVFFVFYFLYRGLLWWRFLAKVSKFDLQLKASHGDDMGGLGFLAETLKAFSVPALAFSVSVASGAANFVLYEGLDITGLQHVLIFLGGFLLIFFVGPLLLFVPVMVKAKSKAILKYGVMEGHQLEAFERHWVEGAAKPENVMLTAADFSSVTDASSIVNRVTNMRTAPFTLKDVISLSIAILLPFLPVVALKVPWSVLFSSVMKLVL